MRSRKHTLLTSRPSRRRFLQSAAAGASVGLPFASLLDPASAYSDQDALQRVLIIHMPNVVWQSEWQPKGGRDVDLGSGDARTFDYGLQSAIFEPIREHTTLIDGLRIALPGGDPHVAGQLHFMTGDVKLTNHEGAEVSNSPSIDQIFAKDSPTLSKGRSAASLNLAAHTIGEGIRPNIHLLSFDQALKAVQPQNDPAALYDSIFASVTPAADPAEVERLLAQDRSVLDYLDGSLDRLKTRLPSEQISKLDLHLEAIRGVEKKLVLRAEAGDIRPPEASQFQGLGLNNNADHERVITGFFELIKSSFAFDLNRMTTFAFASGHNWTAPKSFIPTLSRSGQVHELTHASYAGKDQDMIKISNWYAGKVVQLAQDLASTPDLDGNSTMLDNTMIVFFSEVSITGNSIAAQHSHANAPLAVIGGKTAGHVGGRCLRYKDRTTNDFWATTQQRFGIDRDQFGNLENNTGNLAELFSDA